MRNNSFNQQLRRDHNNAVSAFLFIAGIVLGLIGVAGLDVPDPANMADTAMSFGKATAFCIAGAVVLWVWIHNLSNRR